LFHSHADFLVKIESGGAAEIAEQGNMLRTGNVEREKDVSTHFLKYIPCIEKDQSSFLLAGSADVEG